MNLVLCGGNATDAHLILNVFRKCNSEMPPCWRSSILKVIVCILHRVIAHGIFYYFIHEHESSREFYFFSGEIPSLATIIKIRVFKCRLENIE